MTRIEWWIIGGLTALTLGFLSSLVITSSWWFRLNSLTIHDSRVGEIARLTYDREFYRPFNGHWDVSVWQMDRGEWAAYCWASGDWPYKPATPRTDKTFDWLTDNDARCNPLPAGQYRVELTITANPGTIISRSQTITSNVFEVRP